MCIKVCALWMERHHCSSDCETYGNAGAANAGVLLAELLQMYGWNAYFMALVGACGIIFCCWPHDTSRQFLSEEGKGGAEDSMSYS